MRFIFLMPFFKELRKKSERIWKDLAWSLGFETEDTEEFEIGDNTSDSWMPAFRMLQKWRNNLSNPEAVKGRRMLAQGISHYDSDLTQEIFNWE